MDAVIPFSHRESRFFLVDDRVPPPPAKSPDSSSFAIALLGAFSSGGGFVFGTESGWVLSVFSVLIQCEIATTLRHSDPPVKLHA